jgi:hypothetical protein
LLYKIISVVLTTAVIYISCCSASDSGVMTYEEPSYIPAPSVQKAPKTLIIQEKPETQEKITKKEQLTAPLKEEIKKAEKADIEKSVEKENHDITEPEYPPEIMTEVEGEEQVQPQIPQKTPSEEKPTFTNLIFNALVALGKSILLILSAAAAYLLYKKIKAKKTALKAEKKEIKEPTTIGEAVSSYVKHKLRK